MKSLAKQNGLALFITLLVISIATLLATEIWFKNSIDIAKQYNSRSYIQSNHYAQGMILWAKDVLKEDYEQDANFDNRSDPWNQVISGIQLEDAMLSGKLKEMDSKFNLNNLINETGPVQDQVALFKRLLINLELEEAIADKVIDWMDEGNSPRPQGAEDIIYLSRPPYYRTAGQALMHISELRLIDGIDEPTYSRLKSYVTVLPKTQGAQPTKININLASTVVLRSLVEGSTTQEAIALYNDGNSSLKSVDEFLDSPILRDYLGGTDGNNPYRIVVRGMISTGSQWFQAQVNVAMDQTVFQKFALLKRNRSTSSVHEWSLSAYDSY